MVGPEPETMARRAPASSATAMTRASLGAQVEGGGLEVVVEGGGQGAGVPGAQGGGEGLGHVAHGGLPATGQLIEAPEDRRGGQALLGQGEDPVVGAPGHDRGDAVAAAAPDGGGNRSCPAIRPDGGRRVENQEAEPPGPSQAL